MHHFFKIIFVLLAFSISSKNNFNVEKPNFIIYLSDDQDFLDYNIYGNQNVQSDGVNRLAREGLVFTNFHTGQAICAPSRSQLYTGLYPLKNGSYANHTNVKSNTLTIVQHLKKIGYEVGLAGKDHVGPMQTFNFDFHIKKIENKNLDLVRIKKYLKNIDNPFCLILASDYPHGPHPSISSYKASDIIKHPYDFRVNPKKTGYYEFIKNDDIQLTSILKIIDDSKLAKNSVFIYMADHGYSGKFTLYQKGIKVPFIMRWPNKIDAGSKNNSLLTMVDVLPTILDIAGGDYNNFDGKSFLPIIENGEDEINKYIYGVATRQNIQSTFVFPSRMVSDGKFKLIRNYNSIEVYDKNLTENENINHFIEIGAKKFSNIPYEELFDLQLDPYEKNNLARNKKYNDIKNILSKELDNWMIDQKDFIKIGKIPLLKPTQNKYALDQNSDWKIVDNDFIGKLSQKDYMDTHY